jgi:hypothetical protein
VAAPTPPLASAVASPVLWLLERLVLGFYWLQDHWTWRYSLRIAAFGCLIASAVVGGVWPESNAAELPIVALLILGGCLAGASVISRSLGVWSLPLAFFVAVATGGLGFLVVGIVVLTLNPIQF